ncbi:hypothetical protein N9985_03335, partial [Gammaproteobacteria bacterium]|nr:hypothetical protein [Gammaproteobacteria bacterium]
DDFNKNPINNIARNAITCLGSQLSTINHDRIKDIDHAYTFSVKKKGLKATNQGRSGRCWMFAGLNMFRHFIVNSLKLDQFEFSETYLFFYDKLERCNGYLQWFIDNPDVKCDSRYFEFMTLGHMSDGGWWNTFANLIKKYGIVPKSVMGETYQSEDSEDMNTIIREQLNNCVVKLKSRHKKYHESLKYDTMKQIHSTLVKFLGQPPRSFDWYFTIDDDDNNNTTTSVQKLTPFTFKQMVLPSINLDDFIMLCNIPTKKYGQVYEIDYTKNVLEGDNCSMLNAPMYELTKYCIKSIENSMPVWIAADVRNKCNWYYSALDDELDSGTAIFGEHKKLTKGNQLVFGNTQANHAMCITGVKLSKDGKPLAWQVENSWSYVDNTVPGLDGWIWMSHSWFQKYVIEVVVHRQFLSRTMNGHLDRPSTVVSPFDVVSRITKVTGLNAGSQYLNKMKFRRRL